MKNTAKTVEYILFVYQAEGSPDFLVYDGRLYHRFNYTDGCFHFIRIQRSLPAYAAGGCVSLTPHERKLLEREANRFHVPLLFFDDAQVCLEQAVQDHHRQYVFGLTPPAGYFYLNTALRDGGGE
jgi:hypothetical protein